MLSIAPCNKHGLLFTQITDKYCQYCKISKNFDQFITIQNVLIHTITYLFIIYQLYLRHSVACILGMSNTGPRLIFYVPRLPMLMDEL